ncbi:MAG: hypothetical protein MJ157_04575, partial [Clostridia bacterium]|nr:hypothetical protein [Clostridia bacterium]
IRLWQRRQINRQVLSFLLLKTQENVTINGRKASFFKGGMDKPKSFNLAKCRTGFENLEQLHDLEITRLSRTQNLACMGI